ncbi:MAG: Na+/H+ antiporter subunit E [Desulfurivibrionaceae bacterium]|nr:Na+/H+ antiporter subunit E [Desulfurivibrionaceae bacterium]
MYGFVTFLLMFVLWIIMSGKFDLFHLSLGVISSAIVARISGDLFFQDRQIDFSTRIGQAWRFAQYAIWLMGQIISANLDVVKLALTPRKTEDVIDPHIFSFKSHLKTPFAQFVLANSITLTPGTVTIRIQEDTFYVHAITAQSAGDLADAPGEMERWVAWVFEGGKR